jgi:hypothetical protein
MARRTAALKPQLNQIRTWAREGRTDAWIAYQLGTTALTVQEFRSEHGLDKGGGAPVEEPVTPELVVQTISFDSPPPVVAPAPAPAPAPAADEQGDAAAPARTRRQRRSRTAASDDAAPKVEAASEPAADAEAPAADGSADPERARRRRRRGGRGGGGTASESSAAGDEAVPVAGEQAAPTRRRPRTPAYTGSVVAGAVIVLDPAVARSAAWRAHWADATAFDVVIDDEQIVLRRRSDS